MKAETLGHSPTAPSEGRDSRGGQRDKELLCDWSRDNGRPGTAPPPPRGPPRDSGHGESVPLSPEVALWGPCRCRLHRGSAWRSRTRNSLSLCPVPTLAGPPHPGHLQLPPQERADVPQSPGVAARLPPGSSLPCIWNWFARPRSGLCALLPAGIEHSRPHHLLAQVPAAPTPSQSLLRSHFPAGKGQSQRSHHQPGCSPLQCPR